MNFLFFQLILVIGLCLFGGWLFVSNWSRTRYLLDTPTSKVSSAAQGYVELAGILLELSSPNLFGPLTGKPCQWWRYRIEEYSSDAKGRRWRVIEKGTSEGWLRLSDGSGECLIDPHGAMVLPARREVWTGDQRHPQGTISGSGSWLGLIGLGKQYRYIEERLHTGEPLYAIGDFRTFGGEQGFDLQAAKGRVVREWKGDFAGLLRRFDGDGNGRLDEAEWRLVHLAAQLEAEDRHRQRASLPLQHRLAQPDAALPFVLSSHGQEVLAKRFFWQALGGAVLCLAGALLMAWVLGVRHW